MGLVYSEFGCKIQVVSKILKNCWASSAFFLFFRFGLVWFGFFFFEAEFVPPACWRHCFILAALKSEWRQGLSLTDEGENWHHMGKHNL